MIKNIFKRNHLQVNDVFFYEMINKCIFFVDIIFFSYGLEYSVLSACTQRLKTLKLINTLEYITLKVLESIVFLKLVK